MPRSFMTEEQKDAARIALRRIINGAGSQARLAQSLNAMCLTPRHISQQLIHHWLTSGIVTPDCVLPLEAAAAEQGIFVGRHQLRPDLYPPSEYAMLVRQAREVEQDHA